MSTFKSYNEEKENQGNYVSIGVVDTDLGKSQSAFMAPTSGVEVIPEKMHVTLMFSEFSNVDQAEIQELVDDEFPESIVAQGFMYEAFDSIPKDGQRDENKATLVLKLKSVLLDMLHARLTNYGCTHSYPEFSAHISLYYEVDREECHSIVAHLNKHIKLPISVLLSGYESRPLIKDWVQTLK